MTLPTQSCWSVRLGRWAGLDRPADLPRAFSAVLAATVCFRLWLAAATPFTGDEAYFYWWGKNPDWGFYDHPPMIGWWLALLVPVSEHEWWLRLPVVLQPAALALACRAWLKAWNDEAAWGVALLLLLAPANVWNVLITTDTPLVYFSVFSALAFLRAARDDSPGWYLAAGVLAAGAALSKYFAVFLFLGFAVHAAWKPTRRKSLGVALALLPALPAAGLMAWWNSGHCWTNVLFNLYNRHGNARLSGTTPLLYAVMLAYLLTPPVVWALWRRRAALTGSSDQPEVRALAVLAVLPLALFGLISLIKTVGLHWVLSFVPLVFLLFARIVPREALRTAVRFAAAFAAAHALLAVLVAALPLQTWQSTRYYHGIVATARARELLAAVEPYRGESVMMTDGYSFSATMGYNARSYVPVFGEASSHARHDDILTDFRALDRRDILVLVKRDPEPPRFEPYFDTVEYRTFELHGARFDLVIGRGFRYVAYRDQVLAGARDRWYAVPAFLPMTRCYFCDRYFSAQTCRRP